MRHNTVRLLFLCTANICRSPFAEGYARQLAAGARGVLEVQSAGIEALAGHGVDGPIQRHMVDLGCPIDGFQARQLTQNLASSVDVIVAMERRHQAWVVDNLDAPPLTLTLAQACRGIERAPTDLVGHALLHAIAHRRPGARDSDDVPDPFRGPAEEVGRVVMLMRNRLELCVPRLAG